MRKEMRGGRKSGNYMSRIAYSNTMCQRTRTNHQANTVLNITILRNMQILKCPM